MYREPASGRCSRHNRYSRPGRTNAVFIALTACLALLSFVVAARSVVQLVRPAPQPLRIAINPWPGYEFASLARELGYFEQEGVDVRLLELSSLGDCRRAFERGQADGFFGTPAELINAERQSDRSPRAVLVTNYSDGADVILASEGIEGVPDLRGLRVGVEAGSVNMFVLARALELNAMVWSDIIPVHMAAIDMSGALTEGRVDAVVTYPPMSIEIISSGAANNIFTSKQIPGEVVDLLAVDASVMKNRSADVDAFCRAFFRAQRYARENPQHAYAIMAARQRVRAEDFEAALKDGIVVIDQDGQAGYFGAAGRMAGIKAATERILDDAYGSLPHGGFGTGFVEASDN